MQQCATHGGYSVYMLNLAEIKLKLNLNSNRRVGSLNHNVYGTQDFLSCELVSFIYVYSLGRSLQHAFKTIENFLQHFHH